MLVKFQADVQEWRRKMKEIKKLLLSIGIISSTIFGLFANCTPVKAESYSGQSILESEFISNVYIKKIKC